jgi:hypothetical protein
MPRFDMIPIHTLFFGSGLLPAAYDVIQRIRVDVDQRLPPISPRKHHLGGQSGDGGAAARNANAANPLCCDLDKTTATIIFALPSHQLITGPGSTGSYLRFHLGTSLAVSIEQRGSFKGREDHHALSFLIVRS